MSEYDENRSPVRSGSNSNSNDNDNTIADEGNNSIIGKVKSRVSSIFPNRLSKWFSPTVNNSNNNNNDSVNGNLSVSVPRRRRRIEIEAEDEELMRHDERRYSNFEDESNNSDEFQPDDPNSDEDSNNSNDEANVKPAASAGVGVGAGVGTAGSSSLPTIHVRRNQLNNANVVRQPPTKRSRMNTTDVNYMRDSPLLPHHKPLVASTPAIGGNARSHHAGRSANNRYTHLNLYSHKGNKEPAYNFYGSPTTKDSNVGDIDIIDLVPLETAAHTSSDGSKVAMSGVNVNTEMSSRRSLNIPAFSPSTAGERYSAGFGALKRQTLSSMKHDMLPSTSAGLVGQRMANNMGALPPRRTSTTILETEPADGDGDGDSDDDQPNDEEDAVGVTAFDGKRSDANTIDDSRMQYNGLASGLAPAPDAFEQHKRRKLINGSRGRGDETTVRSGDTASESSEGSADGGATRNASTSKQLPHKTGLFNMSTANGRNGVGGSRTSSIGNDLNFYTHLEGRKSLFAGAQLGANTLNSSTLSLNALNRRQFNASIYGSTSALSDSRLLNTFSPFYKGRTTYGGAAAYNKYATAVGAGTGAGASAVRITPTLIRPTSSLSTLSSSTNSLAGIAAGTAVGGAAENASSSAISSTAKRILDLINDFATPLSEAKKMANNIKATQQQLLQLPQAKARLNESDLQASRAVRLSQVRTPYMRPTVTLPSSTNGKAVGLPPIRELQVPSMSQLLQLKKMQSSTERSRQIAANAQNARSEVSVGGAEYKLPVGQQDVRDNGSGAAPSQVVSQQKHVNKIKNKVATAVRATGSAKDPLDDEPPPPVNLPNIAFPLMQSVPKFDIALPVSAAKLSSGTTSTPKITSSLASATNPTTTTFAFNATQRSASTSAASSSTSSLAATQGAGSAMTTTKTFAEMKSSSNQPASMPPASSGNGNVNFKFSAPLELPAGNHTPTTATDTVNTIYKFSPPAPLGGRQALAPAIQSPVHQQPPPLKTGSVLDALKKPFGSAVQSVSPLKAPAATTPSFANTNSSNTFGGQFKKASGEWECDTCMIRNKQDATKCVACETARKTSAIAAPSQTLMSAPLSTFSSFGSQFKKSSGEWECDACMIRNKPDATKCVACETPHKTSSVAPPPSSGSSTLSAGAFVKSSFGNAFKPKSDTWECSTCMIINKNDVNACVACETKKPGAASGGDQLSTAQVPKFSFGNAAAATPAATPMDSKFKSLAAEQKAAKWECEACMTRNDAARQKCICCEQAKPGSQTVSEDVPKFSFGSAAAKKFSFGFGAVTEQTSSAATPMGITSSEKTDANASKGFVFGSAQPNKEVSTAAPAATNTGFAFGFKPSATPVSAGGSSLTAGDSKDVADSSKIKAAAAASTAISSRPTVFGNAAQNPTATTSASVTFKMPEAVATTVATSAAATTVSASPIAASALASNKIATPTKSSASTFAFGSAATATTAGAGIGFAFGSAAKADSPATSSASGFGALKAPSATNASPTTVGKATFSFGAPTASPTPATTAAVASPAPTSNSVNATAAVVRPMFGFGSSDTAPVSSTGAMLNTNSATTTTTAMTGMFGFGGNAAAKKPMFGDAVSSSSSTTTTSALASGSPHASSTAASTVAPAASTNLFGNFGGNNSISAPAAPVFGDIAKVSSSSVSAPSTTTKTTATFGSFGSATSNATASGGSVFGAVAGTGSSSGAGAFGNCNDNKPTAAAAPMFGNAPSKAPAASTPFVFGSAAAGNNVAVTTTASSTTSWPKTNFVFGGSAAPNAAPVAALAQPPNDNNQPIFGSFGAAQPTGTTSAGTTANACSIFGTTVTPTTAPPAFNSTGSTAAVFGSNAAPSTNLFGSASGAASPFASAASFGAASTIGASPSFSSTAAAPAPAQPSASFGGFGGGASSNAASDGASAAKKSEQAFNFGASSQTQQTTTQGGFNFGAAAKPAFNFATTSQPTFNFTGSAETQMTTKPFQFGASQPAPAYNFSGGAAETPPNAPFQFNAGAAPATTNIFAPTPNPAGAQAAQQARRKIRQPIRRLTPR